MFIVFQNHLICTKYLLQGVMEFSPSEVQPLSTTYPVHCSMCQVPKYSLIIHAACCGVQHVAVFMNLSYVHFRIISASAKDS